MPSSALLHCALGTGQIQALGSTKAGLLDRAVQAGLAVPDAVVLLDAAYQHALRNDWIGEDRSGRVQVRDAGMLVTHLKLPAFDGPVTVQSAFGTGADGERPTSALAEVDARAHTALARALAVLWSTPVLHDGETRRDVLLMARVAPGFAGTALTEPAYEDDAILLTQSTDDTVPLGPAPLAKLNAGESPSEAPRYAGRLQRLLAGVRATFGDGPWQLDWVDDGTQCWLLRLRPVSHPPARSERFRPILQGLVPEVPSPLMTSLLETCAAEMYAHLHEVDPALPTTRPLLEARHGRPLLNLSLVHDALRRWGLPPEILLGDLPPSLRGSGLNRRRVWQHRSVLRRLGWTPRRALRQAVAFQQWVGRQSAHPGASLRALAQTTRDVLTQAAVVSTALTAALYVPARALARTDMLDRHLSQHARPMLDVLDAQLPLRHLAERDAALTTRLREGRIPPDRGFRTLWQAYLQRYGHEGLLDLALPPLAEAPEAWLRSLLEPRPDDAHTPAPSNPLHYLTRPIWRRTARLLEARDAVLASTLRLLARGREGLVQHAERHAAAKRLPDPEALWMLTLEELGRLDDGWTPPATLFADRAAEQDHFAALPFGGSPLRDGAERRGTALVEGDVEGRAWMPTRPDEAPPPWSADDSIILIVPAVSAAWLPALVRASGIVVGASDRLGGGAALLRHLARPAIVGIPAIMRELRSGDRLHLAVANGDALVRRLQTSKRLADAATQR